MNHNQRKSLQNVTTVPVMPGNFHAAAKEFGRTKDVERIFSIKRGTLYNAAKLGLVRGRPAAPARSKKRGETVGHGIHRTMDSRRTGKTMTHLNSLKQ